MKQVSIKSIEDAVTKIDGLDEDALEKLSETYFNQQQEFLGYIFSSVIEYENEQLMDLLMYYFNIFSDAFAQEGLTLNKISDEQIDAFQEDYTSTLDEYMESEDMEIIEEFVNQPHLLSFLVSEVNMKDENGEELDDETATYLFIVGIAMIGLLNNAIA